MDESGTGKRGPASPAAAASRTSYGGVAQLVALLDQGGMGGRGRRSLLSRWLLAHHDAFEAMLADKVPSWDDVAQALAAMGLRDGAGKPPTGERARKAWWAMRRKREAVRALRARRGPTPPPVLGPGEISAGVRAIASRVIPLQAVPAAMVPSQPVTPGTQAPSTLSPARGSPASGNAATAGPATDGMLSDEELQRVLNELASKQGGPKLPLPPIL